MTDRWARWLLHVGLSGLPELTSSASRSRGSGNEKRLIGSNSDSRPPGRSTRRAWLLGFDVGPVQELAAKVKARLEEHQAGSPLFDFDERDLFDWAERSGFQRLRLTLEAEVSHETVAPTRDWTLGELITAALTPEEARRLETQLRPLVEAGEGVMRLAVAYLRASYWNDDPPLPR
jgi:hypothetical protein